MSTNPMQKKSRNSFLLGMFIMLLIALLIAAAIYLLVFLPKQKERQKLAAQATTKEVYVVKTEIKSGDEISTANVELQKIETGISVTDAIGISLINNGLKAKVNLPKGTILTTALVNQKDEEISKDVRLIEYNMITLPTDLDFGDYIDIRLSLSNGQDFIVISKAKVMSVQDSTIGLYLSEEEILIMNSAIVEAYIMKASNFYVVKYVEAGNQEAAAYTYRPTAAVLELMDADTNIINTARSALAELYSKETIKATRRTLDGAVDQYAGDSLTNIEEGIKEQIEAAKKAREDYLKTLNTPITNTVTTTN